MGGSLSRRQSAPGFLEAARQHAGASSAPATPTPRSSPIVPAEVDEEEEHRRWQEMVAKIKAENAPLHPRRSRFEERYETAAPELQSMRLRPAFWEPPDNMLERQIGGKFDINDIPECSSPPPEEFDARPSRRTSSASGATTHRPSSVCGPPPRSAWGNRDAAAVLAAAEQPSSSSRSAGGKEVLEDLDVEDLDWPAANFALGQQMSMLRHTMADLRTRNTCPPGGAAGGEKASASPKAQAPESARVSTDSYCNAATREDPASFTWRRIEKEESFKAPPGLGSLSPRSRASMAMQALRPAPINSSPMRFKSHSVHLVDPAHSAEQDLRVGTVGSTRLPIQDASVEDDRSLHRLEEVQSLPGGSQDVALDAPVAANAQQHRRHSTLGLVACHAEKADKRKQQQQQQQQQQQKQWLGQQQSQRQRLQVSFKAQGGPATQAADGGGGGSVPPVFVSSLYTPFQLPK